MIKRNNKNICSSNILEMSTNDIFIMNEKVHVLSTKIKLHVLTSLYWYHMKGKMNLECNKTMQPFQTFEDLDH